jgi:hypothetical protein
MRPRKCAPGRRRFRRGIWIEPAHRGAGLESGGDGLLDGADDLDGEEQCGQRGAGEPAGGGGARAGRARRQGRRLGGDAMGEINAASKKIADIIRRDRRDRVSDQSAGAECGGRGGARRGAGTRLCGGGLRGEEPGLAQRRGGQGDQGADPRLGGQGHRGHEARRRVRQGARGDRDRGQEGHGRGGGDRQLRAASRPRASSRSTRR